VEVARAGGSHGEATTVLDSVPRRRRRLVTTRSVSVIGVLLVLGGVIAALIIAAATSDDKTKGNGPGGGGGEPTGSEVTLTDAKDFDPEGTGGEHPDEVGLAVDGNPTTAWSTETYNTGPVVADA